MIEFSKASSEHIPELKRIWKVCFNDEDLYIDFFFENKFSSCNCIVATDNGKAIGSAYLMPVSVYEYGMVKKGFYGYAIGILPEYRGKGIYAKMDTLIYDYIVKNNIFYILSPANEKLCDFYKSLGFTETAFVSERILTSSGKAKDYNSHKLSADDYYRLRNFDNMIFWDKASLKYALLENEFVGGENLYLPSMDVFALVRKQDDYMIVTESNVTEENIQKITNYLCERYNTSKIRWILPPNSDGSKILYGLSRNLKKDNYYLNLILN